MSLASSVHRIHPFQFFSRNLLVFLYEDIKIFRFFRLKISSTAVIYSHGSNKYCRRTYCRTIFSNKF